MDLAKIASIPSRFNKMLLPHGNKSLFLPNRAFNVPCRIQCNASNNKISNNNSQTATLRRPDAVFQPSIWDHDYIESLRSKYKEETYAEQSGVLREEVRKMICEVENKVEQLELIDVLQRLGVAYDFKAEIKNMLDNMDNFNKEKSLHATALKFRLLRQHGYDISPDIFVSFRDESGDFEKSQSVDNAEEMLSLYEASFHALEDEIILDEARDFTSRFLKEYLNQNQNEGNYLSLLIDHALELPLHWRIPRWEAYWFIHAYERSQNMSPSLLQLAKLNFNILQTIYHEELKYASRWWKRIGLSQKLNFARDRVVENYIWSVGLNFQPDVNYLREIMAKITSLITAIDDVYDVYGTLEELKLFTEALDRWDPRTIDSLPNYMKICFLALYNFVNETAFEYLKKDGNNIIPYLKKVWVDLCKSYLVEAKWYHCGYKPTFEEYMENAWVSIGSPVMLTHAYFLVPHSFKKEDLVHLEEYSDLIRFSAMIVRLANDLGSSNREKDMGDVSKSIECYMNESGASEAEAREYIKSMLCSTWKKMNKAAHSSCLSQCYIEAAINLARMALFMYQHGDGHSIQGPQIKNRILSLIMQPIITDI